MLDDSLRGLGYYKREFQQCLEEAEDHLVPE